ncbi:UNVERIFIED_CONTAM: hypothetical protein NCL1_57261 [Trichonephila clavipes]
MTARDGDVKKLTLLKVVMQLNENYTFEGAADCCGQDLESARCASCLQKCPGTGFRNFSWGRKTGKFLETNYH